MAQLTDAQLLLLFGQYLPDNDDQLIDPIDLRYVLAQLVAAKVSTEVLEQFAKLASPRFTGTPQVPTAPAGTDSDQVASTAFVQAALSAIAGGKNIGELILPQDVQGGFWYLTSTGIWEARRNFSAVADPVNGPNWLLKASFGGQSGPINAANILDATDAGRAMLTAPSANAQRGLVSNPQIPAGKYGDHPSFNSEDGPTGSWAWVLKAIIALQNAQTGQKPAAPTNVEVDDTADTLSGVLVLGYPAVADYEVFGSPGYPGIVNASAAGADIQNGRLISRGLTGSILPGGAGIRVAASGNRPAGAWMLNDRAFTGSAVVVTPPTPGDSTNPNINFTVPAAGATLTPGTQVLLSATATDNVAVAGVIFTNGATGAVLGQGAKNGNTYTLPYTPITTGPLSLVATATDAAGNSQSATVNVTVQAATTTPTPQPAAPEFSGFDDVANTVSVSHATLPVSELVYDFGGATGLAVPLNNIISVGNAAGQVTAYARATADRPEGLRRNSQPFTLAATTPSNNAPTVTLDSPQAGQTLAVGEPVVLNATPQDADGSADIKRVDHLDNGIKFAETTGFPHTVQRNITAGAHSFTARVYDMLGASGLSNALTITGQATGAGTPTPTPVAAISSVNPASGPVGTTVTVSGALLSGASALTLGSLAAAITSNTANSVTFNVPAGATSGTISFNTSAGRVTSGTVFEVTVASLVPPDRVRKIALSTDSFNKAKAAANRVLLANTLGFADGTMGIAPGVGSDYYHIREWRRDRTMADIGYPDYTTATQKRDTYLRFLTTRTPENWVVDRIQLNGTPELVPFEGIIRPPLDNGCFEVEEAWLHFQQTGSASLYGSTKAALDAVVLSIEKTRSGATYELPYIEDQQTGEQLYVQPFGFFDSEVLTGFSTHIAANYYRAVRRMAAMNYDLGYTADGDAWVAKAARIKSKFNDPTTGLWDAAYGMYRSATIKGREVHDLPSNALAVEVGLADEAKTLAISNKLNRIILGATFRGGVRHIAPDDEVLKGFSCWRFFVDGAGKIFQVLDDNGNRVPHPSGKGKDGSPYYSGHDAGTPSQYGEYQNGAYWLTFVREILTTLAITNEAAAQQFLFDALYYANLELANRDNVECFSFGFNGKFRCTQYAASVAAVLGAMIGGGVDPAGPTPDPVPLAGAVSLEHDTVNAYGNAWQTDQDYTGEPWQTGQGTDYSAGTGLYISPAGTSVLTSQVVRLNGEYAHLANPSNSTLGSTQVRMVQVINGVYQTPGPWIDVSANTVDSRPSNVRWASDSPLTGDYYFQVQPKPGETRYMVFDRLYTSLTRTAPIA